MVSVLRPGQRIINIPAIGVSTSRRAVGGGNGLLNNLVAYWPLNEAAGANNALDLHTNALALTQTASPGSAAGKVYAGARTFDGSTQYFTRNSEALLQTGNVDFTVAAWVYPAAANTTHAIAAKYRLTASANREHLLRIISGKYEFRVSSNGTTATAVVANTYGAPVLNAWALVVAWHDASEDTIRISIDNGTSDSAAHTTGVYASNAPFSVGTYDDAASATFWNGRIGPVAFWKSAAGGGGVLTAAQRTALYNAGAGLPYASFTV